MSICTTIMKAKFKEDDFIFQFNNDKLEISGMYNGIFPMINYQGTHDYLMEIAITSHENAHQTLNMCSMLGRYLMLLNSTMQVSDNNIIKEIAYKIGNESRCCHEVFATFIGMQIYNQYNEIQDKPILDERYSAYYNIALKATQGIKGFLSKNIFLLSYCVFCFNSKKLVDSIIDNPEQVFFDQLTSPFNRLQSSISKINKLDIQGFIDNILFNVPSYNKYIEINNEEGNEFNTETYDSMLKGFEFLKKDREDGLDLTQFNIWLDDSYINTINFLASCLIEFLNDSFSENLGESYNIEDTEILLPIMIKSFNASFQKDAEILNFKYNDNISSLNYDEQNLILAENEKIILHNEKPKSFIIFPEDFDDELKNSLYSTEKREDYHIMLQCIDPKKLVAQYDFYEKEDYSFLSSLSEPILVIRNIEFVDNTFSVGIVPFLSIEDIKTFLEDMPNFFPIFAISYLSAYANCIYDKYNEWIHFLDEFCWQHFILNDMSLYLFLKDTPFDFSIGSYCVLPFEVPKISVDNIAIINYSNVILIINSVLEIKHNIDTGDTKSNYNKSKIVICPGSLHFALTAEQYIINNHPDIHEVVDDEIINYQKKYTKLVLEHIFLEDYIWGLNFDFTINYLNQ